MEAPVTAPRRYLWTDAFAVMTWTGLHERTGQRRYLELALRLIEQVHQVLGAHRTDNAHPTGRGLRIGKPLAEREVDEPYDPELEWERDGQYYHYLLSPLGRGAPARRAPRVRLSGRRAATDVLEEAASLGLETETRDLARLCEGRRWAAASRRARGREPGAAAIGAFGRRVGRFLARPLNQAAATWTGHREGAIA